MPLSEVQVQAINWLTLAYLFRHALEGIMHTSAYHYDIVCLLSFTVL